MKSKGFLFVCLLLASALVVSWAIESHTQHTQEEEQVNLGHDVEESKHRDSGGGTKIRVDKN